MKPSQRPYERPYGGDRAKTLADRSNMVVAIVTFLGIIVFVVGYFPALWVAPIVFPTPVSVVTPCPSPSPSSTPTIAPPTVTACPTARATPIITSTDSVTPLQSEIAQLRTDVAALQQKVDTLSNASTSSEISEVRKGVDSLNTRIASLEQVILDDPVKALSLALLERDFNNLQQSYQSDVQSLRDEMSRLYGLYQWFLGLLVPMAVAVVGLAIRNFLPGRETRQRTEGEDVTTALP